MKKFYIFIILLMAIHFLVGCDRNIEVTEEAVKETMELKSGRYIYGDVLSLIDRETININTDKKSFTYSSSPISSYLTYGIYTNSNGSKYTFKNEIGSSESFTWKESTITYKDKVFKYVSDEELESLEFDSSQKEKNKDKDYNQFDKCTMEVIEKTIKSTGVTVRFSSTNENETTYGSYYRIEKYADGQWKEVDHKKLEGELAWTSEAYIVPSHEYRDCIVDWEWLYGILNTGEYRIIKEIIDFRGTGDYDQYFLAAKFNIE